MRWSNITLLFLELIISVLSTEPSNELPSLKILAIPTVYEVGNNKAIFCYGQNLEQELEWLTPSNEKVEMQSTDNKRIYMERKTDPNGTVAGLFLHDVILDDKGNWTCMSGSLSETIEIIVGIKAVFNETNVTMQADEGKSVLLQCEAKGQPEPTYTWYKKTDSVPKEIKPSSKYTIRNNHGLVIKSLNHLDAGTYICKVRQRILSHYTGKKIHLIVNHKPIIPPELSTATLREVYAIMHEPKEIACELPAHPPPTYTWYKRYPNNHQEIIEEPEMVKNSTEEKYYSILVLKMRDDNELGEYICTANNTMGKNSIVFHVTLGNKPSKPDNVTLVSVNASELTFEILCSSCNLNKADEKVSPDPKNLITRGYLFELVPYKKDYETDWTEATSIFVNITDGNDPFFTVGPLWNNTEYIVRVRTRNDAGYSDWYEMAEPVKTNKAVCLACTLVLIIVASIFTRIY